MTQTILFLQNNASNIEKPYVTLADGYHNISYKDNPTCWKNFIQYLHDNNYLPITHSFDIGGIIYNVLLEEFNARADLRNDALHASSRYDNQPPRYKQNCVTFYNQDDYTTFVLRFS
jgi:hypothetical protein